MAGPHILGLSLLAVACGTNLSADEIMEAPESICYVTYSTKKGGAICSGILVSPAVVATAGHCFQENVRPALDSQVSVQCGLLSQGTSDEGYRFSQSFHAAEIMVHPNWTQHGTDFAFIRLNKASSLEPMRMPESTEDLRADFMVPSILPGEFNLSETLECRSSGFGVREGTHRSHFVTSDQSPKEGVRAFQSVADDSVMIISQLHHPTATSFRHGDSGGAFYCRKDKKQPWFLVGILATTKVDKAGRSGSMGTITATTSATFRRMLRSFANKGPPAAH